MKPLLQKNKQRRRRKNSVRARIRRRSTLPRLSVHRSSKHISAQLIDDQAGRTLACVSTTAKALGSQLAGKSKTERATVVGAEIAKKASEAGVAAVVFDRGPYKYHGRVKALADAARQGGLEF